MVGTLIGAVGMARAAGNDGLVPVAGDVPGFKAVGTGVSVAKRALDGRTATSLRGAVTQGAGFTSGRVRLDFGAFELTSLAKAWNASRALGHGATAARGVGSGARLRILARRGGLDGELVLRVGRAIGAMRLRAPTGTTRKAVSDGLTLRAPSFAARLKRVLALTPIERTFDQVRSDGTFSTETALRAFVIAFGAHVPGAPKPRKPIDPTHDAAGLDSGTLAIDMVDKVRGQLTAMQTAAIDRFLNPGRSAVAPVATARAATSDQVAHAQSVANQDVAFYSAKLLHALGVPVTVQSSSPDADTDAATAAAAHVDNEYKPTECTITLFPLALSLSDVSFRTTIAHETFHCFQDVLSAFGSQAPLWITEGTADWAALDLNRPASETVTKGHYYGFLLNPQVALFARSYGSIGFWAYIDQLGGRGSLWSKMPAVLASTTSSQAFDAAGGEDPGFLDTWASAVRRLPSAGPAWFQQLPYVFGTTPSTGDAYAIAPIVQEITQGGTVLNVGPVAIGEYDVVPDPSSPLIAVNVAKGSVRLGDDHDDFGAINSGDPVEYVCDGSCTCPAGSVGEVPLHREVPGILHVAVLGGLEGATVGVDPEPIDRYCMSKPAVPAPPGGATVTPNMWPLDATYKGAEFDVTVTGTGCNQYDIELEDQLQSSDLYADNAAFDGYTPTLLNPEHGDADDSGTYTGPINVRTDATLGKHTIEVLCNNVPTTSFSATIYDAGLEHLP